MRRKLLLSGAPLALLGLTLFCVDEPQVAVVTALGPFGRAVRTVDTPGLHAKWPWQGRRKFDHRLQVRNARIAECLTQDKKNLVVDWYICWRVAEPELFMKSVRTRGNAELRLEESIRGLLSAALGHTTLDQLVHLPATGEPEAAFATVTDPVARDGAALAKEQYGIEVVDVRLRRVNFPEQNKQSVFDRMRAERERIARKYRAEGEQEARRIRAEADREKERILSEAYRDAERVKGEGDAEATRIYAAAHGADPRFYQFVRTLDVYDKVLGKDTTVVLSADSPLLHTLTDGQLPGGAR
ncbi:MAG: protease modulator HflC [Armatimonadetes bacterium]|nr:protease modulator HflC [Armatimonadota bacterium]